MIKTALLSALLLVSASAIAEYRVYQYYVRSKVENVNPTNAQVVTSTLNPESYKRYNGGSKGIDVTLLRSWMCFGDTSHEDVCTVSDGRDLEENKIEVKK